MALTEFTKDMAIVAKLTDEPNLDGGVGHLTPYTASELKDVFDEGGIAIKTYINGTLKTFVDGLEAGTGLADGSVTTAKLADGAVTTAKLDDGAVTWDKLAAGAVSASKIQDGNITTAKIQDGAVTTNELGDLAVTAAKIANGTITAAKMASNSVEANAIKPANVLTAKIKDKAVTTAKLDDAAVTTVKIADANVTAAKLASDSVTSVKIVDGNVTNAKLASGAVTTTKIVDGNVTKAKLSAVVQTSLGLADTAYQKPGTGIPTDDIADGAVTGDKIDGGTITHDNIANDTITREKLAADANDIYWAEYGTTDPIDIAAELGHDRLPACLYNNRVYVHVKKVPGSPDDRVSEHYFVSPETNGTLYYLSCKIVDNTPTWANGSIDLATKIPSGGSSGQVLAKNSGTDYDLKWVNQSGGGGSISPYTSSPAALGTASAGSSNDYARGDHVHAKPSASDIGAVAVAQGAGNAGNFLVCDLSGNVGAISVTAADVGAVALSQGSGNAGKFLVVGSDGIVTTVTMTAWQGGNY